MIPAASGYLNQNIELKEPASLTFYLDVSSRAVFGLTDGIQAMRQAVYLALETERYKWAVFSWDYGAELQDLFGMPRSWVIPEVKRRISEALLQDTRITAVDNFIFEHDRGTLTVSFTVRTIFGDLAIEKGVSI